MLHFLQEGGDDSLTELSQRAQRLLNIIKHWEDKPTTNDTTEQSADTQLESSFGDSKIGELA